APGADAARGRGALRAGDDGRRAQAGDWPPPFRGTSGGSPAVAPRASRPTSRSSMSRNRCQIDAPPKRVFAVLADPASYAYWVVGSRKIRDADDDWPAVGSAFHHVVGVWPFEVRDHTVVEAVKPGRLLRLKA